MHNPCNQTVGSNFGQNKSSWCLWELVQDKWHKWLLQTASVTCVTVKETGSRELACHDHWERRMHASRLTGGQPSNRVMQGTGLQLSSITDSSCVQLLQQERSKIWSAQDSVLAGFTPFLPWSLNILLCNKDMVLASWKSIYKYGRRCRFATSMLINDIRAVTSLAQ